MTVNRKFPLRFLLFLVIVFMFVLIVYSVFLLQFSSTPLKPISVFNAILSYQSSVHWKASVSSEAIDKPILSSMRDLPTRTGESSCENRPLLRVYMYDLPPEFHFGLMGWKGKANETWPSIDNPRDIPLYPGGLNLQHSAEYWLTLDLLASTRPGFIRPCGAVRVENSSYADVVFVPFFSSLSYNRHSKVRGKEKLSANKMLQDRLVRILLAKDEWKRFGGRDHLFVAHHPNSMLNVRKKFSSAMFVLADFGRYPVEIANLEKDVIAPYKHVVRTVPDGESAPFDERPTLVYFQGAIYRKAGGIIRQELYYLLKDEKDVHFKFGTIRNGVTRTGHDMASSKFCLNIAGDTPSSNRLFDAIASLCVPVIISDQIELPFEDVLDYSEFCIFVRETDAVKKGHLLNLLRGTERAEWTKMWERLKEVAPIFEYHFPSRPGDSVDMIWKAVSRKLSSSNFTLHRGNRYRRSKVLAENRTREATKIY